MGCGTGSGGGCDTCEVSEKRGSLNSTVFDWLYQIEDPKGENKNLVEVQFKQDRKDFYVNTKNINLNSGDWVAVQGDKSGHDIGRVTMKGELVALQIQRKNRDVQKEPIKQLYRIASKKDLDTWKDVVANEDQVLVKARRIVEEYNLEMKLSSVEFQADNTKATFYYTAEKRVDFRELIRQYSRNFGVRIEMRQIGVRQEAAKLGGLGSCGRELCCSTWMTEFPSVSTGAARYQQLSINPQKISGQCGRLKCCLNFELDGYTEALKEFPNTKTPLKLQSGTAKFVKLDVFKGRLFYFNLDSSEDLIELSIKDANKIIELNKSGDCPDHKEYTFEAIQKETSFEDAAGRDSINRFDEKPKTSRRSQRRKKFKKKIKNRQKKSNNENKE